MRVRPRRGIAPREAPHDASQVFAIVRVAQPMHLSTSMKTTSQSRSLQFAVTGALLLGPSASGDLVCGIPQEPEDELELSTQTQGPTVVNPGPAAPPHPITAPPPGVVNPGPVPDTSTMR